MKTKYFLQFFLLFNLSSAALSSEYKPYEHKQIEFGIVISDILVASKENESQITKPILFFCQGSLPIPLIICEDSICGGTFPFDMNIFLEDFHLVIVSKPYIPVKSEVSELNSDYTFKDSTGNFPNDYLIHNQLDFYYKRNNFIIKELCKESRFDKSKIIVAGHSEGATVAAKMASTNKDITHLIFASGNPLGRIMTMIQQSRKNETEEKPYAENTFEYWSYLNQSDDDSLDPSSITNKGFSNPPMEYLDKLKIPVLIVYGTKDASAPYNDYYRALCIRERKSNIHFNAYIGLEHNFFGTDLAGKPNYDDFRWNQVAGDWLKWIKEN